MKTKTAKVTGISPLRQLELSLSPALRRQIFEKIKTRLWKLGSEKLNIELNTRQQPEAWRQIETRLIDEFPDVFYGSLSRERLQYARQAIIRKHCETRNKEGYARKRTKEANKENPTSKANKNLTLNGEIVDLTMDSDVDTSKGQSGTVSQPRTMKFRPPTSQATGSPLLSTPTYASTNVATLSLSCPPASSVNYRKKGFSQVHNFLKSCSPPLGHLLSRFVDLGFKCTDVIEEVASWSRDERLEFLKKLQVRGADISELELIALERRFQKYFAEM